MEAVVEYNYTAQEPDELTLRKGDVIKDIKMLLGGWWEGTLRDKRGMFPDNFVKVLEPVPGTAAMVAGSRASAGSASGEGSISGKSEDVTLRNGGSGRRFCRVLFSYEPCNPDELKLVPNDNIEFLGEVEEGWWRGRLNRRIGVFPSNFVAPPMTDETIKSKEKDDEELCRVLFPYEATNEDELTLVEGDIIRLISRDAPDKGWWQGQLKGQIGLFPDNFVEVFSSRSEQQDQEQRQETNQVTTKVKHTTKRTERANVRKSLDTRNARTDTGSKKSPSSVTPILVSGSGDKKSGNHSILSSLKRLVGDSGSNNSNGSVNMGLEEELDGVERGEGLPLSHLTASRAKAPRRRPPTTQHLRHTASSSANSCLVSANTANLLSEECMTNGNLENNVEHREDDGDGPPGKARRKAPWVDELKLNQLERRKHGIDRVDKIEVRKERIFSRLSTSTNVAEVGIKPEPETEDLKPKESERTTPTDSSNHVSHLISSFTSTNVPQPAYVPYHLYSQLLDRVGVLEEKQIMLQRTVNQLSDQLVSLLANNPAGEE